LSYLLALGSAVLYGAADFLGGFASRKASTIVILIVVQVAGLLPLVLLLPLLGGALSAADLRWSAAAGLAGSAGVGLLYRALAIGTMSIVAPTTAVCAVLLPVAADAAGGERLAALTWAGIALAVAAIVLVSRHDAAGPAFDAASSGLPPGLTHAFVSGVAIGVFFISLARTSPGAGIGPLLVSRGTSLLVFGAAALVRRPAMRLPPKVGRLAVACGVVDALANALYILATRGGPLSVVVTLASLYPASTVMLARVVLGERLSRAQTAGVVCAMVAVVLILGTS
jgi:drug/metabolite transporter (DMT)-like permease